MTYVLLWSCWSAGGAGQSRKLCASNAGLIAWSLVIVSLPGGGFRSEHVRCLVPIDSNWIVPDADSVNAYIVSLLLPRQVSCVTSDVLPLVSWTGVPPGHTSVELVPSATRDWRNDGYDISILEHCVFNFGIQHHLFIHSPS